VSQRFISDCREFVLNRRILAGGCGLLIFLVSGIFCLGVLYGRHLERSQDEAKQLARLMGKDRLPVAVEYTFTDTLTRPDALPNELGDELARDMPKRLVNARQTSLHPGVEYMISLPEDPSSAAIRKDALEKEEIHKNRALTREEDLAEEGEGDVMEVDRREDADGFRKVIGVRNPTPDRFDEEEPYPLEQRLTRNPQAEGAANFSVQVAAYRTRNQAHALVRQLESWGYAAFLGPTHFGSKGRWYRVWVGEFSEKNQARGTVEDLKKSSFSSSFLVSLRN